MTARPFILVALLLLMPGILQAGPGEEQGLIAAREAFVRAEQGADWQTMGAMLWPLEDGAQTDLLDLVKAGHDTGIRVKREELTSVEIRQDGLVRYAQIQITRELSNPMHADRSVVQTFLSHARYRPEAGWQFNLSPCVDRQVQERFFSGSAAGHAAP